MFHRGCIDKYEVSSLDFITRLLLLTLRYRTLPLSSLTALTDALLSELPDESPAVIVVKPERPTSSASRFSTGRPSSDGPSYDPNVVYILELATLLALRDDETMQAIGENVAGALRGIIRDSQNFHPLVISRVVSYLLSLLRVGYVSIFLRTLPRLD